MLKDDIVHIIEDMRHHPDAKDRNTDVGGIVRVFKHVEEDYARAADGMCGTMSSLMLDVMPAELARRNTDALIITATAPARNSSFHHYNMVKRKGEEVLICDMSVAQFLTQPLQLLGGKGYFVGTRGELKEIVAEARKNTWQFLQEKFPEQNFRNLWDVDLVCEQDDKLRHQILDALREAPVCCLMTESFYYAWDMTWGDTARFRFPQIDAKQKFNALSSIENIIDGETPAIANAVTFQTRKQLSRKDSPAPGL